jgi:(+)-trans-carveol dehydrogenase
VPYPMATLEDLAETVRQVEALDRRIVAAQADVRDYGALKEAPDEGVAPLGRLDIVSASAGIFGFGRAESLPSRSGGT